MIIIAKILFSTAAMGSSAALRKVDETCMSRWINKITAWNPDRRSYIVKYILFKDSRRQRIIKAAKGCAIDLVKQIKDSMWKKTTLAICASMKRMLSSISDGVTGSINLNSDDVKVLEVSLFMKDQRIIRLSLLVNQRARTSSYKVFLSQNEKWGKSLVFNIPGKKNQVDSGTIKILSR